MNTKCHSERAESKYLLNFVWHIFLCYTVFDSLGNSPRPLSEEVHSLLPSPEFKKLLSLFGFAGVFGEAVWLWSRSTVYIRDEWLLQLSLGEDVVVLHPPLPRQVHEHIMGHLDFSLSLPQDQIYEVLLLQVKALPRPAFAAMIRCWTNFKAFTSASLKLVILVGAEKRSKFCKRTTSSTTNLITAVLS